MIIYTFFNFLSVLHKKKRMQFATLQLCNLTYRTPLLFVCLEVRLLTPR